MFLRRQHPSIQPLDNIVTTTFYNVNARLSTARQHRDDDLLAMTRFDTSHTLYM